MCVAWVSGLTKGLVRAGGAEAHLKALQLVTTADQQHPRQQQQEGLRHKGVDALAIQDQAVQDGCCERTGLQQRKGRRQD